MMYDTKEIITAIKSDNKELFCSYVERDNSILKLCFGRFPVLTLCYMYNSCKILKVYESQLIKIDDYILEKEPFELFYDFSKIAKKSLRVYVFEKNLISPLEMLAILNEGYILKKNYPLTPKTEKIKNNIARVYDLDHNQIIKQQGNLVYVRRKKVPFYKLISIGLMITFCLAFMIAFPIVSNIVDGLKGDGTIDNPIQVFNAEQFIDAINGYNGNIEIKNDIVINDFQNLGINYNGSIIGGGHTITVTNNNPSSIFGEFSGRIADCNIVINSIEGTVVNDLGLFARVNRGTIENVSIRLNSGNIIVESSKPNATDVLYISGFCVENNGTIKNSTFYTNISLTSNGSEAFFTGFVGNNSGRIDGATVVEGTTINTNLIDIAGIASLNSANAVITNCKNYGAFEQLSNRAQWVPAMSGIVYENRGTVSYCDNYGTIKATSTIDEGQAIVTGISLYNYSNISYCNNYASLTASTLNSDIRISGIASFNNGTISKSYSEGLLKGTISEGDVGTVVMTGIVVDNAGIIQNCISVIDYEVQAPNQITAGISALVMAHVLANTLIPSDNYISIDCYYLAKEAISTELAEYYYVDFFDNRKMRTGLYDERGGTTGVATLEDILSIKGEVLK